MPFVKKNVTPPVSPMQAAADADAGVNSLYASPALPPPAPPVASTPPSEAEIQAVMAGPAKVKKWMLDPTFGDWRLVEVEESPEVITDMIEPRDHSMHDMDLGPRWEEGRGREMEAWWAHQNPDLRHKEMMNGYAPVRPSVCPELKDLGYRIDKDAHLGEVYRFGDTILMEVPKGMHADRKRREEEGRKRDAADQPGFQAQQVDELSRMNGGGGVTTFRNESTMETFGSDGAGFGIMQEATSEADAMMRRNAFLDNESDRRGNKKTFGGFTGPFDGRPDNIGPRPNYGYIPPAGR